MDPHKTLYINITDGDGVLLDRKEIRLPGLTKGFQRCKEDIAEAKEAIDAAVTCCVRP